MRIERLDASHLQAYRALMLQAYTQHPEAFTSSAQEREALPLAWWSQRLSGSPEATEQIYGAVEGTQVLGVAGVSFETREKLRHKSTLFGMFVAPTHRRQGWGDALVHAILGAARQRPGIRLMQLTVSEGNAAALALYERADFHVFGHEPMAVAVGEGFVNKLHLWRQL